MCNHDIVLEIYTDESHTKVAHYRCASCGEKRKNEFGARVIRDRKDGHEAATIREIVQMAADVYGDPFPLTYEEAREHKSGDGLADFIVIELVEGLEGEEGKLERACNLMGQAIHQLQLVEDALMAESVRRDDARR